MAISYNILNAFTGDFCMLRHNNQKDIRLASAYGGYSSDLRILDVHHYLADHQVGYTDNRVYARNSISIFIRRVSHSDYNLGHLKTLSQYCTSKVVGVVARCGNHHIGLSDAGFI
ncbi:hypothetical protein ES703_79682 [subsurface metagenome]